MKKQVILFIVIFIISMVLTACSISMPSSLPASEDETSLAEETSTTSEPAFPNYESSDGAEPAEEFSTTKEAVQKIKEAKKMGSEKMAHPDDFKIYEKDYIYLLEETPLPDFNESSVMLVSQSTSIIYQTDDYEEQAVFSWTRGEATEKIVEERISRFNLKSFKDTKFFFGELYGDTYIYWWENGDEFYFKYPADINIPPEEVIGHLEVVKYDL